VPQAIRSISKENLFLGQSSFNFQHNNINFVSIYRDGVQIPNKPLQPNFGSDHIIRSYLSLYSQTRQYYRDTGNGLSREQFKNGCALFAFDLTPQLDSSNVSFELIKSGNIRLEIHFSAAAARTLTVVIYAEHDNLLEIDRDRSVAFDYRA